LIDSDLAQDKPCPGRAFNISRFHTPDGILYLSMQLVMKKPYFLLSALVTIPAQAVLVIEPEPAPAYIPCALVAPVATPAPYPIAPPNPGVPAQATPQYQQFLPQPAASQVVPGAAVQPAVPAADNGDQAKKLLAEDAAKIIGQSPAKAGVTSGDKRLGNINSDKIVTERAIFSLKTPKEKATDTPKSDSMPKEYVQEIATVEVKSEVVEGKPAVEAELLPSWNAAAGTTLRQTVQGWSSQEGWDVRWEPELLDYPIEQPFSMVGKYLDVITRTFELYKDAKRPFKVEVYPSQNLVVVKEKK